MLHKRIIYCNVNSAHCCYQTGYIKLENIQNIRSKQMNKLEESGSGTVVQLTHIDFFYCGFLVAFLHVLYVSHKLNLLMLSSRLS